MRSPNKSVTRLGVALATALLSLATITTLAGADPPDTTSPPPTSSSESSESSTPPPTPPESSAPSSAEPPPSSEPPETASLDDIEVTATFDEASYDTGEDMAITLTITNTGAEEATLSVHFSHQTTDDKIIVTATSGFRDGAELTVAGGASVTNELTGVMVNLKATTATLSVTVYDASSHQDFGFTVPVTRKVTSASGTVFHDKDGDGAFDSGEGLGGATLTWTSRVNWLFGATTTTNSAGEFSLEVIPGEYDVRGDASGMLIGSRIVVVPESGVDDLLFRARKVLSDLAVDIEFTKDTYEPAEAPVVRVTLTNKGDLPLTEIVADCPYPNGQTLSGKGDGWGELAGAGVTLAPHTTKVLDVTEPMPATAHDHGYVRVDCYFVYAGLPPSSGPRDIDYASVPGQFVEVTGGVWTFSQGVDLSGFRVVVTSPDGGCPIIAEAVTGKDGQFSLGRLPAGRYHYYVVPPPPGWHFYKSNNHGERDAVAGQAWSFGVIPSSSSVPGTLPPDCPGPGGPGTTPPAPQGSAGTGLAYTGASMLVPGIAGLLALLAGTGAVLMTRRRKATREN